MKKKEAVAKKEAIGEKKAEFCGKRFATQILTRSVFA